MRYSVWTANDDFLTNVIADSEAEAIQKAKDMGHADAAKAVEAPEHGRA